MKHLLTILQVAALPVIGIALFATGLLAAVVHLLALPGLYLWEKYWEDRPMPVRQRKRPLP